MLFLNIFLFLRFSYWLMRLRNISICYPLMLCEGGLIAGDLCELHTVFRLNPSHLHTAPWGGQTLQLQFSARTRGQKCDKLPSTVSYWRSYVTSEELTHLCFRLRFQAFWGQELSGQRVLRRWTWAGHSGFCSSRWHPRPGIPAGRGLWRWRQRRLWSCCCSL